MIYAYISREEFLAKIAPRPMIGGMDERSGAILGAIGAVLGALFLWWALTASA